MNIDVQKDPKQWILMKVYKGQVFVSLVQDVTGKLEKCQNQLIEVTHRFERVSSH